MSNSKYDFELDLSMNTSTGLILDKIKKGSTILEFGCAAGRMTEYMHSTLACKVYIVEIDNVAYEKAIEHAEDGLCDDIQNMKWIDKFGDIKFDAILFADVLEHLLRPEAVVEAAANLLKEDGNIIVSVPNITNNDILLKAFYNRFDYTDIGLLDYSHIHFWGLENIFEFASASNLEIYSIEATYVTTGHTEQYEGKNLPGSVLMQNALKERNCGEVYQFVFVMGKSRREENSTNIIKLGNNALNGSLYFDYGDGLCEENRKSIWGRYERNGVYYFHERIEDVDGKIKMIRFDPVEGQECMISSVNIYQNGKRLEWNYGDADVCGDELFLKGNDPNICIEIYEKGSIELSATVMIAGNDYLEHMSRALSISSSIISQNKNIIENLSAEKDAYFSELVNVRQENQKLLKEKLEYDFWRKENERLKKKVDAYITLTNNKDELLVERDANIENEGVTISIYERKIDELESEIVNKNIELETNRDNHEKEIREVVNKYEFEIDEIKASKGREIQDIITLKDNELAYLTLRKEEECADAISKMEEEIRLIKKQKEDALNSAEEQKNQEIDLLRQQNSSVMNDLETKMNAEIERLRMEKDKEIERLNFEIYGLSMKPFNRFWNAVKRRIKHKEI